MSGEAGTRTGGFAAGNTLKSHEECYRKVKIRRPESGIWGKASHVERLQVSFEHDPETLALAPHRNCQECLYIEVTCQLRFPDKQRKQF